MRHVTVSVTIEQPHLVLEVALSDQARNGPPRLRGHRDTSAFLRRMLAARGVDLGQFWRALVRGSKPPDDTPQLRATIALSFFLIWTLAASVGLLIRTTSETHDLAAVVALLIGLYVAAIAILLVGRRIPRRAYNGAAAFATVLVGLAQHLAGTAPAGQLFLFFFAVGTVFCAYFFSTIETALQILLMASTYVVLALAADSPLAIPRYAPLVLVPLVILALLVITIRGRSGLAEDGLRTTRTELECANAILDAVAFAAERFLAAPPWEQAIDDVLARFGAATQTSRVYLNRTWREGDDEISSVRAEWVGPGIPPQIDNPALQRLVVPRALVERYLTDLEAGRPTKVVHSDVDAELASVVPQSRAKTTLAVPIFVAGERWGSLGLQDWEQEREWSDAETDALKAAAGILGVAQLRRRSLRALARRDQILEAVAFAAERFLEAPHTAMDEVLARLGEAAAVTHVHIFENEPAPDGNGLLMDPQHEWCMPGAEPLSAQPNFRHLLLFPQWAEALSRGDVVRQVIAEMPPEHRELIVAKSLRSALIVPIMAAQTWWGEISFDDTRAQREWSAAEVEALRAAAGTIGAAIERKRAEEALRAEEQRERLLAEQRAQMERLRELDRLKDELISTVSHELRTPLTSILALTESLTTRDLDDATRSRYHTLIRTQAERLNALIDDFLDLQREDGSLAISPGPVELGPLLAEQCELFRRQSPSHAIELESGDRPLTVVAERGRVEQVLANLLSNAVKYSPDGGSIAVKAEAVGGAARISVSDDGLGIPEEFRDQIFARFFRVDSSDTRRIGGTGLGLAVSRKIVEAYGGRMGFESAPGVGSTFWFELPLVREAVPA